MWMLTNNTPFSAERIWNRDKNGAEVWLVAVKGTFSIRQDGSVELAEEQEEVHIAPGFRGDPAISGLLYDTDLPHKKNNTDVLIDGHAYAPDGRPATKTDVGLNVGSLRKKLRVTGDRIWEESLFGLTMSTPQPFVKMPLIYERAFGGTDRQSDDPKHHGWERRNPVGCGFATKPEHLTGTPVPNIEYPSERIKSWKQRPCPAGFGPIAGHWSPRVELAGTYDENWEKNRLPLLPADFNESYYQCAPPDQQALGYLKGGEIVELLNMTPTGRIRFRLPKITIGFTTHFDNGTKEEHRGVLHTVIVKPDFSKVIMVWHTNLECHHNVLKLLATTIRIKQRILRSQGAGRNNVWS
ncbi:DUF2169 domain-containing protein [Desulfonema ishimotonii]|uniref:DUF2169 domain-containing protein n=1 Tax=Desulfonema ishimotonii TaxID=45657 RepID=A0A401FYU5_9BACT|nr:DUF2169 domain-containing protein [Desulfonema ishimotonii]GBC62135.1 DUF2169 domain-containing protein [Desulfonema ishimotonii]